MLIQFTAEQNPFFIWDKKMSGTDDAPINYKQGSLYNTSNKNEILTRRIPPSQNLFRFSRAYFHYCMKFPDSKGVHQILTAQKMKFSVKDFFSKCD